MENIFRWEVISICLAVGEGVPPPHPLEGKPCELLCKEIVLQKIIVRKYSTKIVFFLVLVIKPCWKIENWGAGTSKKSCCMSYLFNLRFCSWICSLPCFLELTSWQLVALVVWVASCSVPYKRYVQT